MISAYPRRRTQLLLRQEVVVLFILAGVGVFLTSRLYHYTYDDVFLAFRYAKNILAGNGFVFNPGEAFLGTPAPAYVLLLVFVKHLVPFLGIPEIGGILSGLALTGCSLCVYFYGRSLNQRIIGAIAALFTLVNPFIVTVLGGETAIYLLLVCGAFVAYRYGKFSVAGFLLALGFLNRSEGIIPAALIFGHYLWTRRRIPLLATVVYAVTILPWIVFSVAYFGSPVTNSLVAKLAQGKIGHSPFIPAALDWVVRAVFNRELATLAFLPLFAAGLVRLYKLRAWWLFFSWIICQTIGYLALNVPFYHWYIAHAGLGGAVLAAIGVEAGWRLMAGTVARGRDLHNRMAVVIRGTNALIAIVLLASAVLSLYILTKTTYIYYRSQPGAASRMYVKTGRWLKENTPSQASVAYIEIGQIGYYSDRHIIDVLGLVTPGVASHFGQGNFLWPYLAYKPDYIIYNSHFARWIGALLQQPWFMDNYRKITSIEEPGYPDPLIIYAKDSTSLLPEPVEVDVAQLKRDTMAGKLFKARTIGQTFVTHHDNLCGVEVLFATYGRQSTPPVVFHLIDADSNDLVTRRIPPDTIADNSSYLLLFSPIRTAAGNRYSFYFEAPDIGEESAVTLWSTRKDSYVEGDLLVNGLPQIGDLMFKTYWSPSPTSACEAEH